MNAGFRQVWQCERRQIWLDDILYFSSLTSRISGIESLIAALKSYFVVIIITIFYLEAPSLRVVYIEALKLTKDTTS